MHGVNKEVCRGRSGELWEEIWGCGGDVGKCDGVWGR